MLLTSANGEETSITGGPMSVSSEGPYTWRNSWSITFSTATSSSSRSSWTGTGLSSDGLSAFRRYIGLLRHCLSTLLTSWTFLTLRRHFMSPSATSSRRSRKGTTSHTCIRCLCFGKRDKESRTAHGPYTFGSFSGGHIDGSFGHGCHRAPVSRATTCSRH